MREGDALGDDDLCALLRKEQRAATADTLSRFARVSPRLFPALAHVNTYLGSTYETCKLSLAHVYFQAVSRRSNRSTRAAKRKTRTSDDRNLAREQPAGERARDVARDLRETFRHYGCGALGVTGDVGEG